jgi:hypothetical protein
MRREEKRREEKRREEKRREEKRREEKRREEKRREERLGTPTPPLTHTHPFDRPGCCCCRHTPFGPPSSTHHR